MTAHDPCAHEPGPDQNQKSKTHDVVNGNAQMPHATRPGNAKKRGFSAPPPVLHSLGSNNKKTRLHYTKYMPPTLTRAMIGAPEASNVDHSVCSNASDVNAAQPSETKQLHWQARAKEAILCVWRGVWVCVPCDEACRRGE